jgi:hypothetical protein
MTLKEQRAFRELRNSVSAALEAIAQDEPDMAVLYLKAGLDRSRVVDG